MVQNVEGLCGELQPRPLSEANGARYARIQSDDGGHVEGVASETGGAFVAAVAIVVEVRVDQRGVRFPALGIQDAGELPSFGQGLEDAVLNALGVIQLPYSTENEAMAHSVVAIGAVERYVVRVIGHLAVVGARHHGGGIGIVVDYVAPCVGTECLEVVREAPVHLQDQPVIGRAGVALKLEDASESGKGTGSTRQLVEG